MVVAVAVLISGALLGILLNNTNLFYQESAQVQQGLGLNDSLGAVRSYLKQSAGVVSQYPLSGAPTFMTGANILVLKLPSVDVQGNSIENVFDFVIFYQDQNFFKMKILVDGASSRSAADQILTSGVDQLYFKYFDSTGNEITPASATKVRATLSLKQKAGATSKVNVATSEASLRND